MAPENLRSADQARGLILRERAKPTPSRPSAIMPSMPGSGTAVPPVDVVVPPDVVVVVPPEVVVVPPDVVEVVVPPHMVEPEVWPQLQ